MTDLILWQTRRTGKADSVAARSIRNVCKVDRKLPGTHGL
jgi:hypothetical protein